MATIEATTNEQLRELKLKVAFAHAWARIHFNADRAEDARLIDENLQPVPAAYFVEFPTPDTMLVIPSILGQRSVISISYRLRFGKDGHLAWRSTNANLPPLIIDSDHVKKAIAVDKVCEFLTAKGYTGPKQVILVEIRDDVIEVSMRYPSGLFIVHADGTIEDNYKVLE